MSSSGVRVYDAGSACSVHFSDERVTVPLAFAHVVDLHLFADPPDLWDERYRPRIEWLQKAWRNPSRTAVRVLDDIAETGVDFVSFGGDVLDFYHPEPAERILRLCRERELKAHFVIGNHDWESYEHRFVAPGSDEPPRRTDIDRLMDQ